jgi:glyoxylase-like metal-dependent hydrolase (beta-lactamase superfamily II)
VNFDLSLDVAAGEEVRLSPLVSRLLAPNPGPFTFKGTGVHIVGAGTQVAVIDPGPDSLAHLAALKRALGSRRVSHILVTHTHRDHSPAAAVLKSWNGAKVYGRPLETVATGGDGIVDEAHDHHFLPDVQVSDGMEIAGDGFVLECIATPGHTANHVCYGLSEERALFTGDHVMGWSTSVIAPPDGNMGEYLASLEKLTARDDRILYPTHGSPITGPREWLRQLIAHRRMREAQLLDAMRRDAGTIPAMVERLYPDISPALQRAAAQQVRAHLDHLIERGMVARDGKSYSLK